MTELKVRIAVLTLLFVVCGPFLAALALPLSTLILTGEPGVASLAMTLREPLRIFHAMFSSALLWWIGAISIVLGIVTWIPTVAAGVISGYALRWVLTGIKDSLKRTELMLLSALVCAACSAAVWAPVYVLLDSAPQSTDRWLAVSLIGLMLGAIAGASPLIITSPEKAPLSP